VVRTTVVRFHNYVKRAENLNQYLVHILEYNQHYDTRLVIRDFPEAKVYLPQEDESGAARLQASVSVQYPNFTSYANDLKPLCEVLCPKSTFVEPTLKEWDARDKELTDRAATPVSENIQIASAFNRISAEAEAVEWVNPNLGAKARSGRTVKSNTKMLGWH
jgi:hypothetical protein